MMSPTVFSGRVDERWNKRWVAPLGALTAYHPTKKVYFRSRQATGLAGRKWGKYSALRRKVVGWKMSLRKEEIEVERAKLKKRPKKMRCGEETEKDNMDAKDEEKKVDVEEEGKMMRTQRRERELEEMVWMERHYWRKEERRNRRDELGEIGKLALRKFAESVRREAEWLLGDGD
jgi:hypothetical protein